MPQHKITVTLASTVDGIPPWAQCQSSDCNCTSLATWGAIRAWGGMLMCDKHKSSDAEKLPKDWHLQEAS